MPKTWTAQQEAANLKRLFEGVENNAQFARDYGVKGGGSMIGQHIAGTRPMSLEAAQAYARGFGLPLEAISPRWAAKVKRAPEDNNSAELGALQVAVLALFNLHPEREELFASFDEIVRDMEIATAPDGGLATGLRTAIDRLRTQLALRVA